RAIYAKPALDATDAVRVLEILDALNARAHAQNRADEFRVAAEDALNRTGIQNDAINQIRELARMMTRRIR
ncbi:MAG: hypothetical protein HY257_07445, partial [Chloroflexi bacterium]|nr:hypothetical protein [Chloroflexota bacterium]